MQVRTTCRSALQEALDNQGTGQDPDVIPAGGQQATAAEEAQKEAKKILARVGARDVETEKLKGDLEENAKASRQALIKAQHELMAHSALFFPSESGTC